MCVYALRVCVCILLLHALLAGAALVDGDLLVLDHVLRILNRGSATIECVCVCVCMAHTYV